MTSTSIVKPPATIVQRVRNLIPDIGLFNFGYFNVEMINFAEHHFHAVSRYHVPIYTGDPAYFICRIVPFSSARGKLKIIASATVCISACDNVFMILRRAAAKITEAEVRTYPVRCITVSSINDTTSVASNIHGYINIILDDV